MLSVSCKKCTLNFSNLTYALRRFAYKRCYSSKPNPKPVEIESTFVELLEKHEKKILFNSVLNDYRSKLGLLFRKKITIAETIQKQTSASSDINDVALSVKYLSDDLDVSELYEKKDKRPVREGYHRTHFPFKETITVDETDEKERKEESSVDVAEDLLKEVRLRREEFTTASCNRWMTDYENYDDALESDEYNHNWKINYGTPDRTQPVSNVPCGGCGALLHCQVWEKVILSIFF